MATSIFMRRHCYTTIARAQTPPLLLGPRLRICHPGSSLTRPTTPFPSWRFRRTAEEGWPARTLSRPTSSTGLWNRSTESHYFLHQLEGGDRVAASSGASPSSGSTRYVASAPVSTSEKFVRQNGTPTPGEILPVLLSLIILIDYKSTRWGMLFSMGDSYSWWNQTQLKWGVIAYLYRTKNAHPPCARVVCCVEQ